jgi:hypothetical protein
MCTPMEAQQHGHISTPKQFQVSRCSEALTRDTRTGCSGRNVAVHWASYSGGSGFEPRTADLLHTIKFRGFAQSLEGDAGRVPKV